MYYNSIIIGPNYMFINFEINKNLIIHDVHMEMYEIHGN